ncbi:MAG: hypothetical protein SPL05_02875 [Eubacteriales bacterium]|nr:hypothetical protein [Eubacteriales bacterium]
MASKIETLWQYQTADMEAFKLQREISQSTKRIKLIQSRDFLLKQKSVIEKISADVAQMADRIEVVQDALKELDAQMQELQKQFEAEKPQSMEDAQAFIQEVKRLAKDIVEFEKELKSIQKKSNDRNKQEHDVRISAARVKQEFNALKAEYEPESEAQKKELDRLTAIAEQKSKEVDADLLEKYLSIRKHIVPPIAKLKNNQCGGCDMALPAVSLSEFEGKEYIECANCGRLIIK